MASGSTPRQPGPFFLPQLYILSGVTAESTAHAPVLFHASPPRVNVGQRENESEGPCPAAAKPKNRPNDALTVLLQRGH